MAINGYFFNAVESGGVYDRTYNAEDVTSYLNKIVGNGVFPNPSTQLQVLSSSGMGIIVKAGEGWINGHKMINTADLPLTLDTADALLNRIDRIVFFADMSTRSMGIAIKKGTAATSPTAPGLTRTTTRYEMSLATIRVNKQVTSINQGNITDTRGDSSVCGWVTGLIQQVDTSTLFTQWQTAYSAYYNAVKQQLDAFMAALTEELRVNTYVVRFGRSGTISPSDPKYVELGANMGYDREGNNYVYQMTDVIMVYINGLLARNSVDYYINDFTYTPPRLIFYNLDSITSDQDYTIVILKSVIGIEQAITT